MLNNEHIYQDEQKQIVNAKDPWANIHTHTPTHTPIHHIIKQRALFSLQEAWGLA